MNKKFTKLIAALALLAFMTPSMVGWGQTRTTTYQHVFNAKPSTGNNVTLSSVSWKIEATNLGSYNSQNYAGVQLGSSSKNGEITLTSSNAWGTQTGTYYGKTKITEVRLWLNKGGTSVTPQVTIGDVEAISDGTVVEKNSSAGSDWTKTTCVTFTPATNGNTGVVVINVSTVKAGYICCVQIDCVEPTPDVTAPTITPNGGTFHGTQTVTITADNGCYIYYTLDGSDPIENENAEFYYEPFSITSTKTVKAYALDYSNNNTSSVTTAVFTQEATAAPTFSVPNGYYMTAQSVEISCATTGAEILYTTDGTDPIESSTAEIYEAPIAIDASTTVKAIAQASGYDFSEVATATYTILNPNDATTLNAGKAAYLADNTQTLAFINLTDVEVIGKTSNNLYLQDANAGIKVYGSELPNYTKGDKFTTGYLVGTFRTSGVNTEITDWSFVNAEVTHDNALTCISPDMATIATNYTTYESRYAQFSGVTINGWVISNGSNSLTMYDIYSTGYASKTAPETTDQFTVKGMITAYNTIYEIAPTALSDINTNATAAAPTFSLVGGATASEAVEATSVTLTPATGISAAYTKNAGDPIAITAATEISVEPTGTTAIAAYGVRDFYANGTATTYYYKYPSTSVAAVFMANGVTAATVPFNNGENLTAAMAPSVSDLDGFAFMGWSNSESSTTLVEFPIENVTSNITLYAVYGELTSFSYTKVTSQDELTTGEYVITASFNNKTYSLKNVADNTGTPDSEEVTIDGNNIISNVSASTWLFTVPSPTLTDIVIQSTSNNNLYLNTTNTAKGVYVDDDDDDDTWTITYSNNVIRMNSSNGGGSRYLSLYTSNLDWRNYSLSQANSVNQLTLFKKNIVLGTGRYTRVFLNETATGDITISGPSIIPSGSMLDMGTYTLDNNDPANLIIEDGGQLYTNDVIEATIQKNISKYTIGANDNTDPDNVVLSNGWYFISYPLNCDYTQGGDAPTGVTNLITTSTYDLYLFDPNADQYGQENGENWVNYKAHTLDFKLITGHGYLYANASPVTLEFAGSVNYTDPENPGISLESGYNLVGNPYTYNAYPSVSYYKMNDDHTGLSAVIANTVAVEPCTGIIVDNSDGEIPEITFSKSGGAKGGINLTLAETKRGVNKLDNAIVSFNEGSQLGKFYFGTQNANLYIPQGTKEYAIVSANGQGEMPVNFKANEDGQYTLTVNPEKVEMNYLHLIDNMTGMNVDLLQTPSYSFEAKTTDYESRFRLVFASNNASTGSASDDSFAFFSDGNLIINNEGQATLQVMDITGRILSSETVNGSVSKTINATPGVYMLRLVNGDNVKVQKVVVR